MSNLAEFAKRLEEQLKRADREPHWEPDEAERYMAEVASRRHQFEKLALRLTESVIKPRLETLASCFSNAGLAKDEPAGHSACRFGYCERFPASTKITFSVEHDVRFEKMAVCYEVSMMPVFIKINERDKLTSTLEAEQDEAVADWVEDRLLEFLDAYLRIDRGHDYFEDDTVTDPVCGMRMSRSSTVANDTYRGHSFFFCSPECQEKFAREPTAYVEAKVM